MHIKNRFRGFYPVIIDIETGGFNPQTDAILEIAMVTIKHNGEHFVPDETFAANITPFIDSNINPEALKFNGIKDPFSPLRNAVEEKIALEEIFTSIRMKLKQNKCNRAILVGHNAWFDLHFLNAAIERSKIKSPFHSFSSFDTATMGMLAYKHTVLAEIAKRAGIEWDNSQAHSAIYDAEKTAELFCKIVNQQDIYQNT